MANPIFEHRNELAREKGYDNYYEERKIRADIRNDLSEHGLTLGQSRNDIAALDQIGAIEKSVRDTGSSGMSSDELHDAVKDALLDAGYLDVELIDDDGYDVPWAVIRAFYPKH